MAQYLVSFCRLFVLMCQNIKEVTHKREHFVPHIQNEQKNIMLLLL